MDDLSYRLRGVVERRQVGDEHHRKNKHRARLLKIIATKAKTSFIGALAKFEEFFGHLWGHGKETKSENEKQWLDAWEKCRTEILNNGNKQIRAIENELGDHDVVWHNTKVLPVKGNGNEY